MVFGVRHDGSSLSVSTPVTTAMLEGEEERMHAPLVRAAAVTGAYTIAVNKPQLADVAPAILVSHPPEGVNSSSVLAGPHTMLALSTECLEGEGH